MTEEEMFGRQPQSVTVELGGDQRDVDYWSRELARRAEFKGDMVQMVHYGAGRTGFKIFPRAVND